MPIRKRPSAARMAPITPIVKKGFFSSHPNRWLNFIAKERLFLSLFQKPFSRPGGFWGMISHDHCLIHYTLDGWGDERAPSRQSAHAWASARLFLQRRERPFLSSSVIRGENFRRMVENRNRFRSVTPACSPARNAAPRTVDS